jgi:hypothetical protein
MDRTEELLDGAARAVVVDPDAQLDSLDRREGVVKEKGLPGLASGVSLALTSMLLARSASLVPSGAEGCGPSYSRGRGFESSTAGAMCVAARDGHLV